MNRSAGKTKPSRRRPGRPKHPDASAESVPQSLARTALFRRLPPAERARLDKAILLRPPECQTLEAIAKRFALETRYGITLKALSAYARRLEGLLRPAVTSHLVAVVLGLLPKDYRDRLATGTEVLLLSRLAQSLGSDNESALPITDLVKIASAVASFGRRRAAHSASRGRKAKGSAGNDGADTSASLTEAVRTLYGINWPPTAKGA